MLTTTYSLVTISAEQKAVRTLLVRLRDYIDSCIHGAREFDAGRIESALDKLLQFDRFCHARKVEVVLIPSVLGIEGEIDDLVAQLDAISERAMAALRAAEDRLQRSLGHGRERLADLVAAMRSYCDCQLSRLDREESELLPLLDRALPGDYWFSIATRLLSEDDVRLRRRESAPPPRAPAFA